MNAPDMPKPTDAHSKLAFFAGEWSGEEKMAESPWGPAESAVGRYRQRMDLDGFFLIMDYTQEKGGGVSFRGHGILGYDARRGAYAWTWVDSMGEVPAQPSYGNWDGDTLTLTSHTLHGHGRYTFTLQGKDAYSFRMENSSDGEQTWNLLMEAVYRRG